mmetsp:Transcript_4227/g.6200  ORF Transcript_4227/g.6200 Transcript_4227/m.6200 type:complete len:248 (+) Transcript_4227:151-894(+)
MAYNKRNVAKGSTGPASMHLPPTIYQMFEARPALEMLPPAGNPKIWQEPSGVGGYLNKFEDWSGPDPAHKATVIPNMYKLRVQKKARIKEERKKKRAAAQATKLENGGPRAYDPHAHVEGKTKKAYHTLFVGHVHKKATDKQVASCFERYGKVLKVVRVSKLGCAFVEFERDTDMQTALARGGGSRINGKRIIVDVERARTVKDWKPKSLGGGLSCAEHVTNDRYSGGKRKWEGNQQRNDGYSRRKY